MWEIGRVVISQITFLLANRSWQQIYLKCKYLNTYLQAQLPFFFVRDLIHSEAINTYSGSKRLRWVLGRNFKTLVGQLA